MRFYQISIRFKHFVNYVRMIKCNYKWHWANVTPTEEVFWEPFYNKKYIRNRLNIIFILKVNILPYSNYIKEPSFNNIKDKFIEL